MGTLTRIILTYIALLLCVQANVAFASPEVNPFGSVPQRLGKKVKSPTVKSGATETKPPRSGKGKGKGKVNPQELCEGMGFSFDEEKEACDPTAFVQGVLDAQENAREEEETKTFFTNAVTGFAAGGLITLFFAFLLWLNLSRRLNLAIVFYEEATKKVLHEASELEKDKKEYRKTA